jgi:hypothetical protein
VSHLLIHSGEITHICVDGQLVAAALDFGLPQFPQVFDIFHAQANEYFAVVGCGIHVKHVLFTNLFCLAFHHIFLAKLDAIDGHQQLAAE